VPLLLYPTLRGISKWSWTGTTMVVMPRAPRAVPFTLKTLSDPKLFRVRKLLGFRVGVHPLCGAPHLYPTP
jgi:hypothetical protein